MHFVRQDSQFGNYILDNPYANQPVKPKQEKQGLCSKLFGKK